MKEARIVNTMTQSERTEIEQEIESDKRDWKSKRRETGNHFLETLRVVQTTAKAHDSYINSFNKQVFPLT